jgi:Uma2 family endonuclease
MRPQDAAHAGPIRRLTRLLGAALAGRADVRVQLPLAVSDESEPEPDLAVVPAADTDDAHPTTAMLVVEVARASLAIDRRVKAGLYAAAGVPDCRIVNLVDRTLEVHRDPDGAGYRSVATLRAGDSVAPHAFPDVTFGVSDILR